MATLGTVGRFGACIYTQDMLMFGRIVRYWGTDITQAYARHNGKDWGNDKISLRLEQKLPPSRVQLIVELHLSGLIGTASHQDMQKIRIIGFIFQVGYNGSLKFGSVPAFKPFDHA
jgi:hypothetical protein